MPNGSDSQLILDTLTNHILNTRFEDLDPATLDNTRRRVLDMIGCVIGGSACAGSPELAKLIKDWGGKKEATILGYGIKVPAHQAAMVNCVFGRSFDRGPLTLVIEGDWGPYSIQVDGCYLNRFASHFSETTIMTALAMGEGKKISGREFITALVLGDDLSARLHIASDRTPPGQAPNPALPRPPQTHGSTDVFGATAIAGRLLGFDAARLKNAFGLCIILMGGGLSMPAPPSAEKKSVLPANLTQGANPGWLGVNDPFFKGAVARGGYEETTATKLIQGLNAQKGILAARLAGAGWTGVKDAFFSERGGYYPGLASVAHPQRVTRDLGKKFYVEQVFKPYPGGRPTNAPIEAALALVNQYKFSPEDITEVILHLSRPAAAVHYSKPYLIGEYPTMNALWSFYFAVGSALYRGSSRNENFTPELIRDPGLQALIKKVRLADSDRAVGIELEVVLKDGRHLLQYIDQATGEPFKPMSRDALLAKFYEQVEFSRLVDLKNAEKLVGLVDKLEEVDDINRIIELAVHVKSSKPDAG